MKQVKKQRRPELAVQMVATREDVKLTRDEFAKLVDFPGNPRVITDAQLHDVCRSIVVFGFLDPIIVRAENEHVLGGNQRKRAVNHLLAAPFKYRGDDGEQREVRWEYPAGGIPAVRVSGLSDLQARVLNVALNRLGGEFEHDSLARMVAALAKDNPLQGLTLTGFSVAELTDYVDIAAELDSNDLKRLAGDDDGSMPQLAQKAPNIAFDFSSKELRDAVKKALAAQAKPGEPNGDTLARVLKVRARKPRLSAA